MSSLVRSRVKVPVASTDPRLLGALVLAFIVLLVAVIVPGGDAAEAPPATGAASVVPSDALVYVHLSTDGRRPAVTRALALASRFPDYPLLREGLIARLSATTAGSGLDFARDIRPWLGADAALALLNTPTSTAGSLIVLDVADRAAAKRFLVHAGPTGQPATYRRIQILPYRAGTEMALIGRHLAIGQDASVRAAIDIASGGAPSLQANPAFKRASAGAPASRVLDAYASVAGVRRVLAPQGGVLGALGALLYQPALEGVSVALSAASGGVKVRVHSALDPAVTRLERRSGQRSFTPTLDRAVPSGTTLLLDVIGLDRIGSHLLGAGSAGGALSRLGPLLRRLGAALQAEGVDVQRDVLSLFAGETAVAISPRQGRPALVIVAPTRDEGRTRTALAALEAPLARLFPPPGTGPGSAPVFNDRQVAGVTAHQLALAPGLELDYAVFDGKLVVSTSLDGVAGVRNHDRALADEPAYRSTLGDRPQRLTSLLFLDFNQLLSLGEQTGLTRSARYRSLRPDLSKVRAVGLSSTSGEADSTAELFLQIS
jgi:hypothetical protein